ncbi:MAG: iron-sulfur cluster assembly accessory protein [Pseudobdellovibrionaceae bacterium]
MKLSTEITITDAARAHLLKASFGAAGLRLEIKGGKGCGGNEYDLHPVAADQVNPQDDYVELGGEAKLFVASHDLMKLFGMTIDFVEDKIGSKRLDIRNPNETGRCGCGKSVTF